MTMKQWLLSLLGYGAPDEMLDMELNNLYFRFCKIDVRTIEDDLDKKCYEHLQTCFKAPPSQWNEKTWDDAYRIEKQIAMLLRDDLLHQEIKARLREAADRNVRDAAILDSEYKSLCKAIEEKHFPNGNQLLRNLLRELLENIHWHSKLKYLKRQFRLEATIKMLLFVVVALLFVLGFYLQVLYHSSQVPILLMAGTCGLLGALFSRLINLHSQWDVVSLEELRHSKAIPYILLRSCIGVCGALILYFILRSQTVEGPIFPKIDKLTTEIDQSSYHQNVALLIVWSIIAGFSESLVPSVLSTTGQQLTDARK